MNDIDHPDHKKKKEKPHLTLVIDNTGTTKDELAKKWKESRDNKNSEINQTESTRAHIFGNIQKTMNNVDVVNREPLQSGMKKSKHNGITIIIRNLKRLLNSIKKS